MAALDLTDFEWHMLASLSLAAHAFGRWQSIEPSRRERAAIDYLVLSGLVERRRVGTEWSNHWRLTDAGAETIAAHQQVSLFA